MGYGIIIFYIIASIWNVEISITEESWSYSRIHYNFGFANLQAYYPSLIDPKAICKGDTTYIIYENELLDPTIIYYNDKNSSWGNPVVVGDSPMINDDHGCPSILRDNSGYLYVFYGCHNSRLMMNKSTNPDDITVWEDQDTVITPCTYPKPIIDANGNIWVFYRGSGASGDGELSYTKSTDDGDTWSSVTTIMEMDSNGNDFDSGYGSVALSSDSTKIHYAWCTHKKNYYRRNLYYAWYDLETNNWYNVNDNSLGILIDRTEADDSCLITPYGTDSSGLPQIHLYNDNPYITFLHKGTKWQQEFIYHNGSNWSSIDTICTVDGYYTSAADFIIYDSDSIQAFMAMDSISSIDSERGGEMVQFTWNGTVWDTTELIASRKEFCALDIPTIPQGYNGGNIKLIFTERRYDCIQACPLRVFAWGPNGFVKRTWE